MRRHAASPTPRPEAPICGEVVPECNARRPRPRLRRRAKAIEADRLIGLRRGAEALRAAGRAGVRSRRVRHGFTLRRAGPASASRSPICDRRMDVGRSCRTQPGGSPLARLASVAARGPWRSGAGLDGISSADPSFPAPPPGARATTMSTAAALQRCHPERRMSHRNGGAIESHWQGGTFDV